MSTKYKATMPDVAYFVTITSVGWIDVFTRLRQKYVLIQSLMYCQKKKGLEIYAYCIMPSHVHLLCKAEEGSVLSDIMRDFKKHTSKKIIQNIMEFPESRREWMLDHFKKACQHLKRGQKYKVWQDGYHAQIAKSNWFIKQKVQYKHNNPVAEKIVASPEDYVFSSARNYSELENELEVTLIFMG
ncbi:REP-associated tyrosine transposase [Muriicola sp.]|uniref:REP-associated tyrosine transposase n=1 Tax=Muriicola sp. TaxID=2020856 RepID=UPI003C738D3D